MLQLPFELGGQTIRRELLSLQLLALHLAPAYGLFTRVLSASFTTVHGFPSCFQLAPATID